MSTANASLSMKAYHRVQFLPPAVSSFSLPLQFPGSSFTGQETATASGTIHLSDSVASKAKDDLMLAYDDAAGRTPVTRISSELGGANLKPGTL